MRHPYRFVIRALPAEYRQAHGDELVDTARELGDGRWSPRESALLLTHGLRTRALQATAGSGVRAVSQAVITSIELVAVGMLVSLTMSMVPVDHPFVKADTKPFMIALMVLTAAALVSRSQRLLVASVAVLTIAAHFAFEWPVELRSGFTLAIALQAILIVAAGGWALGESPTRMHPGRSTALLVGLTAVGVFAGPNALSIVVICFLLAATVVGLIVARWDPRLLLVVACAFVWEYAATLPILVGEAALPLRIWIARAVFLAFIVAVPTLGVRRLRPAI